MLVHNLDKIKASNVNGPGTRAVIWVSGCNLGCKGCWNPDTHKFDSKTLMHVQQIADYIATLEGIDGVTFSGGEPMQQAPQLYLLLASIREANKDLSFGMYTGYTLKELEEGKFQWRSEETGEFRKGTRKLWEEIKSFLDFAVMGRYNQAKRTTDHSKPLIGSTNQEVVFFTDRYSEKDLQGGFEVVIPEDGGLINITGFPIGIDQ